MHKWKNKVNVYRNYNYIWKKVVLHRLFSLFIELIRSFAIVLMFILWYENELYEFVCFQ